MRSKLDEICHLSSEIWFSDNVLLAEPVIRFCQDWELAIVFKTNFCKLKMLFPVHFIILAEATKRLCYHSISCQKKKKRKKKKRKEKAVRQSTRDYYRYFLRVSSGATYYERGIERQVNVITCCIHNSFNCYYYNVLQLNDDPTKKI